MTFYSKFLAKVALRGRRVTFGVKSRAVSSSGKDSGDQKADPDEGQDQAAVPELPAPGEAGDRRDGDGAMEGGHGGGQRNVFAEVRDRLLFICLRLFFDSCFFAFVSCDIGAVIFD